MAPGPSGPDYHLRGPRGSAFAFLLYLPFCSICPVMARSLSSERALRRRTSYHLPYVSFAHLYVARPEQASISFAFLLCVPILWHTAHPRSERSVGGQVIIRLLFHLPTVMARGWEGQLIICLAALCGARPERASLSSARPKRASLSFPRPERASLSFAFMPDLTLSPPRVKAPHGRGRPYYSI